MLKAKENAVLIALFIVFMCTLLFHKVNYNIDELLSYGLANHISGGIEFDDGVAYTPAQQPWLSYLTAGGGEIRSASCMDESGIGRTSSALLSAVICDLLYRFGKIQPVVCRKHQHCICRIDVVRRRKTGV